MLTLLYIMVETLNRGEENDTEKQKALQEQFKTELGKKR